MHQNIKSNCQIIVFNYIYDFYKISWKKKFSTEWLKINIEKEYPAALQLFIKEIPKLILGNDGNNSLFF